MNPQIDRPVLILSCPRSGSTLLFETLARAPGLFTTGGESHKRIEGLSGLAPRDRGWSSNRLTGEDATLVVRDALSRAFHAALRDRDGRAAVGPVRMVEKTPKNALRVPFFDAVWPDCQFVYLYRDARQTLASMIDAWLSGRFRTYPGLPDWPGLHWSLLLVPGWEALRGLPLAEIVARQWEITTRTLLDDFEQLPRERVRALDYAELLARSQSTMEQLCTWLDLGWDVVLGDTLPLSRTTTSPPEPDKWRALEDTIAEIWPIVAETDARARRQLE